MKVKIYFRASRGLIGTTHLYALPSAVRIATALKRIHTALHTMCPLPSIFLDPPLVYHPMAYRGNFFLHSLVVLASELSDGNPLLSSATELVVGSVSIRDSAPPHCRGD